VTNKSKPMAYRFRAFSIIEIVIAAALIAALGLALFTLLKEGIRTKNTVNTLSGRYHSGRQAMERMVNELSMAYLSGQFNTVERMVQTDFLGEKEKVSFDAFGNSPFTKGAKESDQREISYFIDKDKDGKSALMRRIHNNLTRKLGEEGIVDVLCSDVRSLEFKYWDDTTKEWQSSWSTQGAGAKVEVPTRISIALVIMISAEKEQKFLTEVETWIQKPIMIGK
jgi:general secretion pathway protein J